MKEVKDIRPAIMQVRKKKGFNENSVRDAEIMRRAIGVE